MLGISTLNVLLCNPSSATNFIPTSDTKDNFFSLRWQNKRDLFFKQRSGRHSTELHYLEMVLRSMSPCRSRWRNQVFGLRLVGLKCRNTVNSSEESMSRMFLLVHVYVCSLSTRALSPPSMPLFTNYFVCMYDRKH